MNDTFETWEGGEPEVFGRRRGVGVPTMGSLRSRVPSARYPRPSRLPGRFAPVSYARPVPYPDAEPWPADGGATEEARWVQDCLNRVLNLQLPMSGRFDAATRSAIRSFQQRHGLAVTGIASPATRRRLDAVCEGGEQEVAALIESGREEEAEEEIKFEKEFTVNLYPAKSFVSLSTMESFNQLPTEMGIYFIHSGQKVLYVGRAQNIRERFNERLRVFKEFNITPEEYLPLTARVKVSWYRVTVSSPLSYGGVFSRPQGGRWKKPGNLNKRNELVLRALEPFFIRRHKKKGAAEANSPGTYNEQVCTAANGKVTLRMHLPGGRKDRDFSLPLNGVCP
jgi:hypothetical protein